jgi:hemoglobin-like flavoprotein
MTPHQVALVQSTFAAVAPRAEAVATLFYQRLFELDPSLRGLFRGDMTQQGEKLMAVLARAVSALDRLPEIAATLRALGARHSFYGVQRRHYDTVGNALLWALERTLGEGFTPAVRAAWLEAYVGLTNLMCGRSGAAAGTGRTQRPHEMTERLEVSVGLTKLGSRA